MEEPRDVGIAIEMNGSDFMLTRYNTTVYTFWGKVMVGGMEMAANNLNHIYIQTSEEADVTHGGYLFKDHPAYKEILKACLKYKFPSVLYAPRVPEGDMQAWEKSAFGDIRETEGVPESWNTDESA